ncbi:hypothetical protein D3C72_1936640 [compost metagenome]
MCSPATAVNADLCLDAIGLCQGFLVVLLRFYILAFTADPVFIQVLCAFHFSFSNRYIGIGTVQITVATCYIGTFDDGQYLPSVYKIAQGYIGGNDLSATAGKYIHYIIFIETYATGKGQLIDYRTGTH